MTSSSQGKDTSTPFERGRADGQWTFEQVRQCGFASVEECLAHQEGVYEEERASLVHLYAVNPVYAAWQAEYLEGLIAGERACLRELAARAVQDAAGSA